MTDFTVYDEDTAPEQARPMLAGAKRRLGFVSTLTGVMAESPELLAGYNALFQQFQASSLPGPAKHVVLITTSVANGCRYCVAAHSTMASTGRRRGCRTCGRARGCGWGSRRRCLHAELRVQALVRVDDHHERQASVVGQQFLSGRVEHDDIPDARRHDLLVSRRAFR
jgi:AhpD family alkylhydroperoxidase